jgi:hypothetical protein
VVCAGDQCGDCAHNAGEIRRESRPLTRRRRATELQYVHRIAHLEKLKTVVDLANALAGLVVEPGCRAAF